MATVRFDRAAFDRATDGILQFFTVEQARALAEFRGDPAIRSRIDELASRNTEGELTEGELAEYEGYVKANNFIATLQTKARKLLSECQS